MTAPFKVGEKVSLAKWDATNRKQDALSEGKVIATADAPLAASGLKVRVLCKDGVFREFDSGWLEVIP